MMAERQVYVEGLARAAESLLAEIRYPKRIPVLSLVGAGSDAETVSG
jgi:hypothetical protein